MLVAISATARATITPDERACQAGRGRAVYDMIAAEAACVRRCRGRADADCRLDADTAAARCVARAKARTQRTLLGAACRRDCPECYGGCGPDVAAGEVGYSSGLVATFASVVYCVTDPTPAEARCTQRVARAAAWFARQHGRCFVRCHAAGCDGAGVGDARTARCTGRAWRRAAAAIDAGCTDRGTPPGCFGGRTGDGWIDLVRGAVDHGRPVIFCGSPAAAFVE
jgi:hypothetical protein